MSADKLKQLVAAYENVREVQKRLSDPDDVSFTRVWARMGEFAFQAAPDLSALLAAHEQARAEIATLQSREELYRGVVSLAKELVAQYHHPSGKGMGPFVYEIEELFAALSRLADKGEK